MKCPPTLGVIDRFVAESIFYIYFSLQGTNETDGRACTKICRTLSVEEFLEGVRHLDVNLCLV